jgi:hypothetical protein
MRAKTEQPMMSAKWRVEQDGDTVLLHVRFWNGHAISITAFADDAVPPFVALRSAGSESDLAELDYVAFRCWCDGALGRRG